MGLLHRAREWNFDIDHYLNRIVPPSPLHKLPTPVSRYLGYREQQKQDVGNILGAFWSCLGAFCGLAVIAAIFNHSESIQKHHPPALIASFGASAVLEYNSIRSPLGQPRNAFLGHTLSALVGVAVTKLFQLHSNFESLRWVAGATSCGIASSVMLLTGTVHPPGGASAVLAATNYEITDMGWYFVGLVSLATALMLLVGLVVNNIQRQFPIYWWTPLDLRKLHAKEEDILGDARGGIETKSMADDELERTRDITISAFHIGVPAEFSLNSKEVALLEGLKERLRKRHDEGGENSGTSEMERVPSSRPSTEVTVVDSSRSRNRDLR